MPAQTIPTGMRSVVDARGRAARARGPLRTSSFGMARSVADASCLLKRGRTISSLFADHRPAPRPPILVPTGVPWTPTMFASSRLEGKTSGTGREHRRQDLDALKERRGEKIAAVDPQSQELLGWITVYPERSAGGPLFRLADIQVMLPHRGKGIGTALMRRTGDYLRERKVPRLKFGTSPLLTWNAGLFMKRCGMRYIWKEGMKTPGAKPWPYVSCEWDLDDQLEKPHDLREDACRRGASSTGRHRYRLPERLPHSGRLFVPLPDLSGEDLITIVRNSPDSLVVLHGVFHDLFLHGYRFAWFDTLSAVKVPGCRRYYLNPTLLVQLEHIILSHHGSMEFGSPIPPRPGRPCW